MATAPQQPEMNESTPLTTPEGSGTWSYLSFRSAVTEHNSWMMKKEHPTSKIICTESTIVPSVPDDSMVEKKKKNYIFIASQISMKFKYEYNFDPTFFSFFQNIVENPYYMIILVIGIAISVSDFLYK